jgi:hypothetical protein
MHYSHKMVLCPFFSSQQEPVACMLCIQKESHCCEGQLSVSSRSRECQFEQQANIKFCQNVGKSASETFHTIKQACGKEALGCSAVFKWHKHFAQGRDSLQDDDHTSWPRMVRTELRIQEVAMLVRTSHAQLVYEIAAAAGTCHNILIS